MCAIVTNSQPVRRKRSLCLHVTPTLSLLIIFHNHHSPALLFTSQFQYTKKICISSMSSAWNDKEEDDESSYWQRFLLPNIPDTEEIEDYAPGGFHPVHLGDTFDNGRYIVRHKLGAGGFATVWLAHDENERMWVALKIIIARHSTSISHKKSLNLQATSCLSNQPTLTTELRRFTSEGPNGCHLCLVLPVLGPSMSRVSHLFTSRLQPWLARRVGYQATKAVAALHVQGLCHGGKYLNLPPTTSFKILAYLS